MRRPRFFRYPDLLGVEFAGRQLDLLCTDWVPLSVREGKHPDYLDIRLPILGWHIRYAKLKGI